MKAVPIPVQISRLEAQVKADISHWHDLRANGCNDPFWPDGVNLNLVRNHIIYGLRQIAELSTSERQLSINQLRILADEGNTPITLLINSPGGDVVSGFAIYDTMNAIPCDVRTVCIGGSLFDGRDHTGRWHKGI